jgi:hypothetical protein
MPFYSGREVRSSLNVKISSKSKFRRRTRGEGKKVYKVITEVNQMAVRLAINRLSCAGQDNSFYKVKKIGMGEAKW